MTTTHYIVYGGIAVAVLGALLIGKSLDRQQSNSNVTWQTGCIGMKTILQSIVLGLIIGPVVYLIKGGKEELWFCVVCMMAAPFIVDLLRPTVTINKNPDPEHVPEYQVPVSRLNTAYALAIGVCVVGIGLWTFIALK